jgi:hypothetical protein
LGFAPLNAHIAGPDVLKCWYDWYKCVNDFIYVAEKEKAEAEAAQRAAEHAQQQADEQAQAQADQEAEQQHEEASHEEQPVHTEETGEGHENQVRFLLWFYVEMQSCLNMPSLTCGYRAAHRRLSRLQVQWCQL